MLLANFHEFYLRILWSPHLSLLKYFSLHPVPTPCIPVIRLQVLRLCNFTITRGFLPHILTIDSLGHFSSFETFPLLFRLFICRNALKGFVCSSKRLFSSIRAYQLHSFFIFACYLMYEFSFLVCLIFFTFRFLKDF